jgi:hypothetical protein
VQEISKLAKSNAVNFGQPLARSSGAQTVCTGTLYPVLQYAYGVKMPAASCAIRYAMLAEGAPVLYFWRNGGDTLKHGGPTTSTKGWRRESRANAARMAIGRIKKKTVRAWNQWRPHIFNYLKNVISHKPKNPN